MRSSGLRQRFLGGILALAAILTCSRPTQEERREISEPTARIGYGTAMADLARRFELVGRAAVAARFELAQYELEEIGEQFEETLPHAALPKEGHPEVLPSMAAAFLKVNVAELRRALATHDRTQVAAAFERTAQACNQCHQVSGHAFIEVPLVAGRSIPVTDASAQ
jgi:mono/diheme cytochrome c family protein